MNTPVTGPSADSKPPVSRRALLRGAGAAGLLAVTASSLALGTSSTALAAQGGWRWCNQCQGLWFAGDPNNPGGACAYTQGGPHSADWSGNYVLHDSSDGGGGGQDNWRWCSQCEGLWFLGNASAGVCPYGVFYGHQAHDWRGSGDYVLYAYPYGGGNQDQWYWCHQCQGLWFAGNSSWGVCPAGGGHDLAGSGDYYLTAT